MLVLSRRIGESVLLYTRAGEEIRIKICDVQPGRARIAFEAPGSVKIVRDELVTSGLVQPPKPPQSEAKRTL